MHNGYQTAADFLQNFPKSAPASPLEHAASGGVGCIQQFAIMPITPHHTVNLFSFYFVHNCAVSCFKSCYGKQSCLVTFLKKNVTQDKDEVCE